MKNDSREFEFFLNSSEFQQGRETMILICDREGMERSIRLRERIRKLGCPCALTTVSGIRDHLPVKLILTYCDLFDEVRRTPWDSVFVVAIGQGFVNTALNAKRAETVDAALQTVREFLLDDAGIEEVDRLPFGVSIAGKYFFSDEFFEIYGNMVIPTPTEYQIFRYLFSCTDRDHTANAEKILRFCLPDEEWRDRDAANYAAVHIANLNRKLKAVCGKRLIRAKRNCGYYWESL